MISCPLLQDLTDTFIAPASFLLAHRHSPLNLRCEIRVYLTVISIDRCPSHS